MGCGEYDVKRNEEASIVLILYYRIAYRLLLLSYATSQLNPTAGLSITRMPYNETSEKDCPYFKPFPIEPVAIEEEFVAIEGEPAVETVTAEAEASSSSGPGRRKTSMMIPHCYTPKPQIHSLLLHGGRLTAIVSEQTNHYSPYAEDSLFWDYQELAIKVYDAEDIPLDGSPLKLLGEKKIQGNYHDARSIDSSGIVITTSHVNTDTFTGDLYRWNSIYCGMSNSEYEALAKKTALNKTESFTEKMMKDLELELGGNCEDIFQVAAMQAGDSKDVYFSSSNLLGEYDAYRENEAASIVLILYYRIAYRLLLHMQLLRSLCESNEL